MSPLGTFIIIIFRLIIIIVQTVYTIADLVPNSVKQQKTIYYYLNKYI